MSLRHLQQGEDNPSLGAGSLRIYSMQYCPYAQRTRLVLQHKNIPHDVVNINLRSKPSWFLEKNPVGTVPTLEQDGKILWESVVCNDYLDELYPDNQLNPKDPYEKARQKVVGERWGKVIGLFYGLIRNPDKKDEVKEEILKQLQVFEDEIKDKNFFAGDNVGMVDYIIWPHLERLYCLNQVSPQDDALGDYKSKFPGMAAYIARMLEVPAVKATFTQPETLLKFLNGYRSGNPQYDDL